MRLYWDCINNGSREKVKADCPLTPFFFLMIELHRDHVLYFWCQVCPSSASNIVWADSARPAGVKRWVP